MSNKKYYWNNNNAQRKIRANVHYLHHNIEREILKGIMQITIFRHNFSYLYSR